MALNLFYFVLLICESKIESDVIPQERILDLVAEIMKNEKIKPSDHKAVFIEQELTDEPDKIILKAIMSDITEQKGVDDEKIIKPELRKNQTIYTDVFTTSKEFSEKVIPVEEMPDQLAIMSGPKPKEVDVVIDVTQNNFSIL